MIGIVFMLKKINVVVVIQLEKKKRLILGSFFVIYLFIAFSF